MINMPVEPAITEHMYRKATHRRIPLGGTFEITPLCNMNCRMCYVRLSKQEQESLRALIPGSKWIELGREAVSRGMLYLLVTGGEPFCPFLPFSMPLLLQIARMPCRLIRSLSA